jgi:hypothetical protein
MPSLIDINLRRNDGFSYSQITPVPDFSLDGLLRVDFLKVPLNKGGLRGLCFPEGWAMN